MQPTENASETTDRAEYRFSAVEHKLLADFEAEGARIKEQANQALRDLNQRSFGALQLILQQQGLEGDWEVTPGLVGVRRKEKPAEPPKE